MRSSANSNQRGQKIRISAPPRLTGACAREQASPRATDRPPARRRGGRAAQVSPRRVNAAAKYTARTIRAGHGRVRRLARVTARGGTVRDEDHQLLPLRR